MKKILFREHKGSLEDAMKTAVEVECLEDIMNLPFIKAIEEFGIPVNLKSEFYAYDSRIDWNTYIITSEKYGVVGFTNGELN